MEANMDVKTASATDDLSSFTYSSYRTTLIMYCEKLLSYVLNKTSVLHHQELTPPYIRHLLAQRNLTLHMPKTMDGCIAELHRLINNTNEVDAPLKKAQPIYGFQEHSRSLIVFVFLIGLVSIISVLGNLCLAKVLYSKRFRLLQTDRIVLCLALSELCLVLIDSPTEIYRFLSYSFSQTWLCRFHTFLEALFSSCIIFYHLLGAFDRFVYVHGHTTSYVSSWSKWCRRASTKSGSIILLILPILCSLPIAFCNLFHAHVLMSASKMKICIVQYTHGFLISFLIFFYVLPLVFAFFLHAKLIYFIRSKHQEHYFEMARPHSVSMKRYTLSETQVMMNKQRLVQRENALQRDQSLLRTHVGSASNVRRSLAMSNTGTKGNTPGTIMTVSTTAAAGQPSPIAGQKCGHVSLASRSSTGTMMTSTTVPTAFYKINSQANANANRTVLLLVLLLSFYVLCWAPYNIYTWRHAYQLTSSTVNQPTSNRTSPFAAVILNQTATIPTALLVHQYHADLRRIILVNYSLYLLSMISMCFSFIFYFSLNKQAREELRRLTRCICPCFSPTVKDKRRDILQKPAPERFRIIEEQQRRRPTNMPPMSMNQPRMKTAKNNHHVGTVPPSPLLIDTHKYIKYANSSSNRPANGSGKRKVFRYGCHIECCR